MKLSAFSLRTIRFSQARKNNADIDEVQTEQIIDYAIKHEINYYDTTWSATKEIQKLS